MIRKTIIITALLALSIFPQQLKQFHWMTGVWRMQEKIDTVKEVWTRGGDSVLTGRDFLLQGRDTIWLEEIKLKALPDGVYYIPALPEQNDGKPVYFKFIADSSGTYYFENPQHDFPQKIVYKNQSPVIMRAWIEGLDNGEFKRYEYSFRKEE